MEINNLTMADFTRIVSQVTDDTAKIKLSDGGLKSTKLPTWASTNQKAMTAFIETIKREIGAGAADMASVQLHAKLGKDKPLTVRAVRETIDDVVRMTQRNLNIRDKFLSGIDSGHCFDKSFEEMIDAFGFRERMSDSAKASLKTALRDEYIKHFTLGSEQCGNLKKLDEFPRDRSSLTFCVKNMAGISINAGELSADFVSLAKLLKSPSTYGGLLLQSIPQMRAIQPEGELTAETVWQAVFNEPLPHDIDLRESSFVAKFDEAVPQKLEETMPGKGAAFALLCSDFSKDKAHELLERRNITFADLPYPERSLKLSHGSNYTGEQLMARDVCRRSRETVTGRGKSAVSTPPSIHTAGQTFVLGKEAGHVFGSELDKKNYLLGKPSSYSGKLMGYFWGICEGNAKQADMTAYLVSQAPMRKIRGTGGMSFGSAMDMNVHEHSATEIFVEKAENGNVRVRISTFDLPDAVRYSGYASLTYDVTPEGEAVPVDLKIMSKFGETAETLASLESDESISDDELRSYIAEARNSGSVSEWEAEQLLNRIETRFENAQAVQGTEVPKIHNQQELFEFFKSLSEDSEFGQVQASGTARDFNGEEKKVHTYNGLVFRGDSRRPQDILKAGGFKSKNDLGNPQFMQEAQGLGKTIGATGTSGVSASRVPELCLPYCNYGSRDGYVYVIDTAKLGDKEQAYDMESVFVEYKKRDESGKEVNLTSVPREAIVGWVRVPGADDVIDAGSERMFSVFLDKVALQNVAFNEEYTA